MSIFQSSRNSYRPRLTVARTPAKPATEIPDLEAALRYLFGVATAYIVDISKIPQLEDHVYGLAGVSLDLALRDEIGAGWRGRGPAIGINVGRLLADFYDEYDAANVECLEAAYYSTFIHEATHISLDGFDLEPEAEPIQAAADGEFELNVEDREPDESIGFGCDLAHDGLKPVGEHDARFWRMYLHVALRARAFGIVFNDIDYEFRRFGLSDVALYAAALRSEQEKCFDTPLMSISRKLRMPTVFQAIFAADAKRWPVSRL